MVTTPAVEKLAKQKLEAFERFQPEFEASFRFFRKCMGRGDSLHFLWLKRCIISTPSGSVIAKTPPLSVFKSSLRYEGSYCLDLLRYWQKGETAVVVAFLAFLEGAI